MLVTIVAIANADNTGLDLDRLEKVEDLPEEVARTMLQIGTARKPSDEELDEYEKAQAKDSDGYDNGGELPAGPAQARNTTGQDVVVTAPDRPARTAKRAAAPVETAPAVADADAEPPAGTTPGDGPEAA